MANLLFILKIIYLNRFRKLTFKDASYFWIILGAYFILIFKIFSQTFPKFPQLDLTEYILITFCFLSCTYINDRTDWKLLRGFLSQPKIYLIYLIDLLIINVLNLFASIYLGYNLATSLILILILFFTFYKIQSNKPLVNIPFPKLDVLNITQFRKDKFLFIILFICYYVIYQSILEENKNLYVIVNLVIVYILIENTNKTEKLEYFLLSKFTSKQYITQNERAIIKTALILLFPSLILSIIYKPEFSLYCFLILSSIPLCFPLKYINFNKRISIAITQFLVLTFMLSFVLNDQIDWILFLIIIILSIILHRIAFRKFTKEKIQNNSEYYL